MQLEGLTQQQAAIADILWNLDTRADVAALIGCMPREYKQDAELVFELMQWAALDDLEHVSDEVTDYILGLR